MNGERGSALAVVLLILGVLGLLGAGLMVQTRYDTKVVSAQGGYDKMLNLADGSAKYSLFAVRWLQVPAYTGQPVLATDSGKPNGKVDSQTVTNVGDWTSLAWFVGLSTDPWDMPGFEVGLGTYHQDRWVAKGAATQQKLDSSFEVDQSALYDIAQQSTNPYLGSSTAEQRKQSFAQSSAMISAVNTVPSM